VSIDELPFKANSLFSTVHFSCIFVTGANNDDVAKFDIGLQEFSRTNIKNSHYESKVMVSYDERLFIITEQNGVKEFDVEGELDRETIGACAFES
jgi:hypothetical protein